VSDDDWAAYLYLRTNSKGVHAERWRHTRGCGRFFNALRDTTTDRFIATYKAGEKPPNLSAAGAAETPR
jgi:sarcosine oxidase subunit delta